MGMDMVLPGILAVCASGSTCFDDEGRLHALLFAGVIVLMAASLAILINRSIRE